MFRPLTLMRRVKVAAGHAAHARADAAALRLGPRQCPRVTQGSNHIRYVGAGQTLRLTSDAPLSLPAGARPSSCVDRPMNFILGPDETLTERHRGHRAPRSSRRPPATGAPGRARLAIPLEWQDAVIRAAITLKMSLFEDTGAIVAAMTTSIPEAPDSGRNWDYRFCWLRDAFFVVRALNSLSEVGTMEDYLRWLNNMVVRSRGGHIQPLYGIGQEEQLPEAILEHLPGYRGKGPVRVGNQAQEHFQHDVYGNIILGASQSFHDHRLFRRAGARRVRLPGGRGRAGVPRLRPARRRHVGAAHARPHPHLVGADELGRLRPAGQGRRDARPARAHPLLARARRHACASASCAKPGASSARPSPRASAAATSTPARC